MRNIVATIVSLFLLALMLGYMVFWHVLSMQIESHAAQLLKDAEKNNIKITGGFEAVRGFPRRHELVFSGTLEKNNITLTVPSLRIRAFPVPGQMLEIFFSRGLQIKGNGFDENIWSLDELSMSGIIPESVPSSLTVEGLRAWRSADGKIVIDSFALKKESLHVTGSGFLTVDNDLQPAGEITAHITGHTAFLGWLQTQKILEQKQALITGAVLNGLSRQNPQTGERFIDAGVTIQDSNLLLGPITLMPLPVITWDYDTPAALPFEPAPQ